uniref:NADH-ubiquinone oxidoreductase chain 4 n=1 Tax=Cyclopsetta fimbriata TaxID=721932 RepID=A0A090ARA4_9PLEU|nr:NADH dehydrogenase subunit 4 [Cyclopsetta fimbriata]BAP58947.1 NADH dehydrogenase subunit 4 [Cyclopsetta fimbriata]
MMKILMPTLMLIPMLFVSQPKWVWPRSLAHSFCIALLSLAWLSKPSETGWMSSTPHFAADALSAPFIALTCWLLPLTILASQKHMSSEPIIRQRTYIALLTSLQLFLIMAFTATELMMFYVMFEATLIPTLIIITRWGNQTERLNAGTYFLFYTLVGSLPLLVALLVLEGWTSSMSFFTLYYTNPLQLPCWSHKLWWAGCLIAFLVKMPLYGLHLWLPKAHVEAPIAGSMILAAVLLKLGGYGMIRILSLMEALTKDLCYPFVVLALWGVIMAGLICLRQTDLKSLIAYSSVSHMCLVAIGVLIQTPWGLAGAVILMIAHGLTSSALFCLANTNYERTHTRTLILARGLQLILPLMTAWWFIASLANLALPPLPNLMGELMIITTTFNWSWPTIALTGAGTLITAGYSLHMFLMSQRGALPSQLKVPQPTHTREHLLLAMHMCPLLALTAQPELIAGWNL